MDFIDNSFTEIVHLDKYYKKFNLYPNEITILAYDALGLIYYAWKKNGEIKSVNDFLFKNKIQGKIGTFSFKNGKVTQELDIYKTENKKFVKLLMLCFCKIVIVIPSVLPSD